MTRSPGQQPGDDVPRRGVINRDQVRHVYQHELDAAEYLAASGDDVIFVPQSQTSRSADIIVRGERWEIKSPTSSNPNTIAKRLGRSVGQASKVIFSLHRTSIPVEDAATIARGVLRKYPGIEAVRLVGRSTTDGPLDMMVAR